MGPYCRYCNTRCFLTRVLADGRTMLLATCATGMEHDRATCGEDHTTAVNPVTDPDGAALRGLYAKAERAARCTHGADCAAHPDARGVHVDDITPADVLHAMAAEMRIRGHVLDELDLERIAGLLGVDAPPRPRPVRIGGPGYSAASTGSGGPDTC